MTQEPRRGPGRPRKAPPEPGETAAETAVEPTAAGGKGRAGRWDKSEWMARMMRVRICVCGHVAHRHDGDDGMGPCHASAVWEGSYCQCHRFRQNQGKVKEPKGA